MKSYFTEIINNESVLIQKNIEVPSPGDNEVLIKVNAAGLNRGGFIVGGVMHGSSTKPGGTEAAGDIVEIGKNIKGYSIGDKIMGRVLGKESGAFAEYTLIKDYQIMPIPKKYSYEEAAAIPVSFLAAYDAVITYGKLKQNEWVLISAIPSAVGVAALQISQVVKANTIGTSSSKEKIRFLKEKGLDYGIQLPDADLSKKLKDISQNGIDVVVNCLGGSIIKQCMESLAFKGRLIAVGYMDGINNVEIDFRKVHANRFSLHGVSNAKVAIDDIKETVNGFKSLILPALEKRHIEPIIDKVFDFDSINEARIHMMTNKQIGKIVVKI